MATCRRGTSNCAFSKEAGRLLPAGMTKLYLRSNTAGYQQDSKVLRRGLLGHLCDAIDAMTAVPNARLLAAFLNGGWRRECPPLSLTPAEVARGRAIAPVAGAKFSAAPKAAQAQRVENLILAWEAAHRQFPTAANIA
jgi:hypothetical protein